MTTFRPGRDVIMKGEKLYARITNELATQLIAVFWDVYHQVAAELEAPPVDSGQVADSHRRIVDALRAHDAAQARRVLRYHFEDLHERVDRMVEAARARSSA